MGTDFIKNGTLQSWILEFEKYLKTPFEQGGSGRYFSIPIENPTTFWLLFNEFSSKWPKGIEMKQKGLFFILNDKMITCS